MSREGEPEWFDAQYEKLPFICFSCGLMGHSELECANAAARNEKGKLPYDREIPLCAPEEKRKKFQSFGEAAANSYGSGTSSGAHSGRLHSSRSVDKHYATSHEEHQTTPIDVDAQRKEDGEEVMSPLKKQEVAGCKENESAPTCVGKQLFQGVRQETQIVAKKRKSKQSGPSPYQKPDLNLSVNNPPLIPARLVHSQVNQIVGQGEGSGGASVELLKKQNGVQLQRRIGGGYEWQPSPDAMKILCLNCRGLDQPEAVCEVRSVIKLHRPVVVFLSETRLFYDRVDVLKQSFGFPCGLGVGSYGRGGGLAMLWSNEVKIKLQSSDKLHIDVVCLNQDTDAEMWRFTGFYGESKRELRYHSWDLMRLLGSNNHLPWLYVVGGQKIGRGPRTQVKQDSRTNTRKL
jgi:hypothetical protein